MPGMTAAGMNSRMAQSRRPPIRSVRARHRPRVLRLRRAAAGGAARRRAARASASSRATASPSSPRTARTMSRLLYAHLACAGSPPCRPTPSCTAPSSATSSNNPARGCASPPTGSTARSRRMRRTASSALIVIGSAEYRSAVRRRPDRGRAARRRRSRLAVLHLRHHRPAEGRDAHPSRAGRGEPRLSRRGRCGRARRPDPARRADEPRLRPLHHGACHAARRQRGAGIRRLRAGGDLPPVSRLAAHVDVRRAHHGQAAGRMSRPIARARTSAPSSGAARRCMSRTR